MTRARPTLLEPIMNVEVYAPSDFAGDLMGDLNSRRGRIAGMDTRGASTVIRATVPMAEMLTYEQTLTSHDRRARRVPHGVLALRRGAGTPARQDHRGLEGRARRSEGRRGIGGRPFRAGCHRAEDIRRRRRGPHCADGPLNSRRNQRRRCRSTRSSPICASRRCAKGISQATLDAALTGLEPLAVVVTRDRAQPGTDAESRRLPPQRLTAVADRERPHAGRRRTASCCSASRRHTA